jgi:hypothetical protein
MKVKIGGRHDLLGSIDARRQFEDLAIQRFREKLDFLKRRLEIHNQNAKELKVMQDHFGGDYEKVIVFDAAIADSEDWSEYNKAEWTALMATLQALSGEDPGDGEPIDTEAITAVLIEYRKQAEVVGVLSDGRGTQNASTSAAGLQEAVESAVRELGEPGAAVRWKVFCAKVWKLCGVEPEASGYSQRTIRRVATDMINPRRPN